MQNWSPAELREKCRNGVYDGPTSGYAQGYVQTNMVILPSDEAAPFASYCARNPKPCPVLEQLEAGDPIPQNSAPTADIRIDLPRYRVFEDGKLVAEPTDITDIWRDDLVTFLLGCSFTAEEALLKAGLPLHHLNQTGFVPMYRTNIATKPAGRFAGPLVVTMRPFTPLEADRAADITSRYPLGHGGPVHRGDPADIGIANIHKPDYAPPLTINDDQICVFWACGVTPQEAIAVAKPALTITHSPGHMFVTDIEAEATRV